MYRSFNLLCSVFRYLILNTIYVFTVQILSSKGHGTSNWESTDPYLMNQTTLKNDIPQSWQITNLAAVFVYCCTSPSRYGIIICWIFVGLFIGNIFRLSLCSDLWDDVFLGTMDRRLGSVTQFPFNVGA